MNRIQDEISKLNKKNIKVNLKNDNYSEIEVIIAGPEETPFASGFFKLNIEIPQDYPFKSPSIGFGTRIFHPNIDEISGSICLDVLNQVWSPMFDLSNIVEVFIPQLLAYPNPLDPLNADAANLYINDKLKYEEMVKKYIKKYAVPALEEFKDGNISLDSDSVDL